MKLRNKLQTREAILKAAYCLFVERGYDAASLREITRLAGVNESLVARYFGSKQRLFTEAVLGGQNLSSANARQWTEASSSIIRSGALSAIVRSAASEEPRAAIKSFLQQSTRYHTAFSAEDGQAEALAALIMALALGIRLMRDVFSVDALTSADAHTIDDLCTRLMVTLGSVIDEMPIGTALT